MFTMAQVRKLFRQNPRRLFVPCPVCGLAVDPRNRNRHAKACRRRKRLAPELWAEWREDMLPSPRIQHSGRRPTAGPGASSAVAHPSAPLDR